MEKGFDQVVYLDPDIYVYRAMTEVERPLSMSAFMVLTPHLTGFLDDDMYPSEVNIMQSGSFNLGFIALVRHPNLIPFINWWKSKCEFDCVVDIPNGIFVDQKWIDLVPGIFNGVYVLRHEGYNVAYWNLKHRIIEYIGGKYFVNRQPLTFFHFSGLNPLLPEGLSKHQNRFQLKNLGVAIPIITSYCQFVIDN